MTNPPAPVRRVRPASYSHATRTPRPALPPRPQTRPSKPKGLPSLGERLDLGASSDPDSASPTPTPYRLPKIKADEESDELYKVWSRYGYDVYTSKPVELEVLANQMETTPRLLSQEMRRANHLAASYPKFRDAMISPVHSKPKMLAGSTDPAFYKGCTTHRPLTGHTEDSRLASLQGEGHSSSAAFSRCTSPAKSAKSIKWALTPYRNIKIDKKGRSHQQGPFSRQFTVTCAAPNNWLRLKFTRAKTFIT